MKGGNWGRRIWGRGRGNLESFALGYTAASPPSARVRRGGRRLLLGLGLRPLGSFFLFGMRASRGWESVGRLGEVFDDCCHRVGWF